MTCPKTLENCNLRECHDRCLLDSSTTGIVQYPLKESERSGVTNQNLKLVEIYLKTFEKTGQIPDHDRLMRDLEALKKFIG